MPAPVTSNNRRISWMAAAGCAAAGVVLFQFWGNASRGYVDSPSAFWWWVSQWIDPRAEAEHGWLILGLSAWLLWRNLRRTPQPSAQPAAAGRRDDARSRTDARVVRGNFLAAIAAMLAALALHYVGFVAQQTRISLLALLLFVWGTLRLGGGARWGRAAVFPLGFLVFAIPVNVLDSVGFWLRMGVIDAAEVFSRWLRLDVVRSGTQLFAGDGRYQYDVAAACSGVRSLAALAALSLLIGYVSFRTVRRRAFVFALCLPLTYLGNVVRIVVIIVAAHAAGQQGGERAHEVMGFGVFVIVLGGALLATRAIERLWPERLASREVPYAGISAGSIGAVSDRKPSAAAWLATTLGVIGLTAGLSVVLAHTARHRPLGEAGVRLTADGRDPAPLPAFIGTEWIGQTAEVTAVERAVLPSDTGFSRRQYRSLQSGAHSVFVSIVLSGRDRTSLHRPEICLVGQGWTLTPAGSHVFNSAVPGRGVFPATLLRSDIVDARTKRPVRAVVAYGFVSSDGAVRSHAERFWRDAWTRLRHGRADRWAYVLLQADAEDGVPAAVARMQTVFEAVAPVVLEPR